MHDAPPLLNDPDASQFREMCWGCGSARSVLVVEKDEATQVMGGVWCWLCGRAVHQDCLSRDNPATLGCRNEDCPLFPARTTGLIRCPAPPSLQVRDRPPAAAAGCLPISPSIE